MAVPKESDIHSEQLDQAQLLFACAMQRCPLVDQPFTTVQELVTEGRQRLIQEPYPPVKIWAQDSGRSVVLLMNSLRSALHDKRIGSVSDDNLWAVATDAAVKVGSLLVMEPDDDQAVIKYANECFQNALSEIEESVNQKVTVWIPISDLYVDPRIERIGIGRVTIRSEGIGELLSPQGSQSKHGIYTQRLIDNYDLHDESNMKKWAVHFQTIHSSAEITIEEGDDSFVWGRAYDYLEESLAVIRVLDGRYGYWSGHSGRPSPNANLFSPRGFFPKGMEIGGLATLFSSHCKIPNESAPDCSPRKMTKTLRTDITQPVKIELCDWKAFKPFVEVLSGALLSQSKMSRSITKGIQVFDESIRIHAPSAAFLGLMNSIEILIGGNHSDWNESIRNRVSERPAFLFSEPFSSSRQRIAKQVRDLYDVRSGITHGGKDVDIAQIRAVEYLARKLILRLAIESDVRKWQSPEQFLGGLVI